MDNDDRSPKSSRRHRRTLTIETLEGRWLLTTTSTSQMLSNRVAQVRHEYHEYVGELQHVELKSQATPAEELALRDDARAIAASAATTILSPELANAKAVAVTLQLDRAVLDGWMGARDWALVESKLGANLDGLNVPPALVSQTVTDMKAIAASAGVTWSDFQKLSSDGDALRDGEASLPSYAGHFPNPGLYFSQHLRGFFRGGAVQRRSDEARLNADLRSIETGAHDNAAEASLARRDVQLLEGLGASLTSESNRQAGDVFAAAFAQGPPNAQDLARVTQQLDALPGVSIPKVNRLVADTGAFFQAVGSTSDNVRQVVADVQAVVEDGAGAPLNPFLVRIPVRTPAR